MQRILLTLIIIGLHTFADSNVWSDERAVGVELDVSQVPELRPWGENARKTLLEWYPRICNLLPTKGFVVSREVHLRIRKSDKGVAGTAGNKIVVSSHWIEKHPEDIGVAVHELVHVVQAYSNADPGWVTEGIADYIRWAIYEGKPQSWFPISDKRRGYRDGYQVAAGFLLWLESDFAPGIVKKLNTRMRQGKYEDRLFEKVAGIKLDELWKGYVEARSD
jgi:hypothetical protein